MSGMVAVVTGGSSGIGKATAKLLSQNGYKVYELSRSGKDNGEILHITADVTDETSIKAAFSQIFACEKRLDLLVSNAGFGISGPIELTETDDAERQFNVNFFGTLRSMKAAIPYMRKCGGGRIICVSSAAAIFSIPFQSIYSCSKSAVNMLVQAAANELRPFNIKVSALMPGDVKTGFTSARKKGGDVENIYAGVLEKAVSSMEKDEENGMSPEKIAREIYKISKKRRPKVLYAGGFKYKLFVLLSKMMPLNAANRIVGMMYCG